LNAKCAAMAAQEAAAASGRDVPLMISMTITDMAGRNLSGHTVEAFWAAIRHVKPLTVGLNCSFGADLLRPHLAALSKQADTLVMAYPNAGLPNDLAEYDELPETTAQLIGQWLDDGLVNIVGGCCGTTPAHIAAIAKAVEDRAPRPIPQAAIVTRLAGLEPFIMAA
jgi:5-methyltetrahydrofolate--homocysteine methyltransferase